LLRNQLSENGSHKEMRIPVNIAKHYQYVLNDTSA
jgi:hypothetical protein